MNGLTGSLDVVCTRDASGKTFLSRQAFSVPFHISKPYWNGKTLLLQVVNPTAGLFSADRLTSHLELEMGAASTVVTPSASRVYTAASGQATLEQVFKVATGGWLDYTPAMLIPQAGSRYRQTTCMELEKGASCFFLETLAPGRVASGEAFAFASLEWASAVIYDGELILREQFRLRPEDGSLHGWRNPIDNAFIATGFVAAAELRNDRDVAMALREASDESLYIGLSALAEGFWAIRILAATSIRLRAGVRAVRTALQPFCPLLGIQERWGS